MNQSQVESLFACLSQLDDHHNSSLQRRQHHSAHHSRHGEHDEDGVEGNIMVAKATAMAVLFSASAICGSIPFLLNRYLKWTERQDSARSAWIVQCLLYFGGGVLLATTFLHLLPEVQEVIHRMEECHVLPALPFSLAELLMCTGFFLMYLIEVALHLYIHRNRKRLGLGEGAGAAFERGHSVRNSCLVKSKQQVKVQFGSQRGALDSVEVSRINDTPHHDHNLSIPKVATVPSHDHGHGHTHLPVETDGGMLTSSLRGLFIVLALSLHELFEGMAIGLETQSAAAVWFMFGAVSAHKLVLAFCVGVELIVARTRLFLAIIYVVTFAIVSPIGIGIGILLSTGTSGNASPSVPSAILQGMACGTLLYVVFFEILSKDQTGLRTYFALVFGFVIMFAIQEIGGNHGHSHGNCEVHISDHDHGHEHGHEHSPDSSSLKERTLEQHLQLLHQISESLTGDVRKQTK